MNLFREFWINVVGVDKPKALNVRIPRTHGVEAARAEKPVEGVRQLERPQVLTDTDDVDDIEQETEAD